ncbi:MAG: GGDEF domain-containing protein, partial [Chloroflexota bacterium]
SDGSVVSSNRAFDSIKALPSPSAKFEEHIPPEEKAEFRRRLKLACNSKTSPRWILNLIIDEAGTQVSYDAIFVPASSELALLFAERIAVDPEVERVIDKLTRQVKLFRIESEQAKKIAINKQAEIGAIITQAEEVSNMDVLTFLPNRRRIISQLQNEVIRAERYHAPLSISIADVDHFKTINDTYGHNVGDYVLQQIAILLRDNVRQPDQVARYGGEEFLILLPNSTVQAATEQAARLCKQIRESVIQSGERTIHVSISIGVAQFQRGIDNWQTLLSRADTAMYEAKKSGRDGWATAEPGCS